jgi:peroxiredoxin (alkyl hydroperoxide reductase subunit C)
MSEETNTPRGMLTVGDKFPDFNLPACVSIDKSYFDNFKNISLDDSKGKWRVIFFYPFDFTFICPTELVDFNNHLQDFKDRDTELYTVSGDSEHVHLAWRKEHKDLSGLNYPMIADYKKELTNALGIVHKASGAPLRAAYIIDPDGMIKSITVNDLSVGRNAKEIIRVLDGFQSGELCPACWDKGDDTLKVA